MVIINATTENSMILPIGRQDERNVREVWFDLKYMIDTFGEGTAELHHQRAGDPSPYPCTVQRNGTQLVWKITKIDNAIEGIGKAEIRWHVDGSDDDMAKTVVYKTYTLKSLTGDSEVPDPYESWYEALLKKIGDSQEYAEQAAESAETAKSAARTAANDATDAVRTEMTEYVNSARQSADTAQRAATKAATDTSEAIRMEMANYTNRAETAANDAARSAQALSGMTVTVGATDKGSGIVEISATVNRG